MLSKNSVENAAEAPENTTEEVVEEPRCTCNDEYVSIPYVPCPVHFPPTEDKQENSFGEDTIVVTDAYLTEEVYGTYEGFKFNCPACSQPAIMVNKDMGKFCAACGKKVLIKSHAVSDFLRKMQQRLADQAAKKGV